MCPMITISQSSRIPPAGYSASSGILLMICSEVVVAEPSACSTRGDASCERPAATRICSRACSFETPACSLTARNQDSRTTRTSRHLSEFFPTTWTFTGDAHEHCPRGLFGEFSRLKAPAPVQQVPLARRRRRLRLHRWWSRQAAPAESERYGESLALAAQSFSEPRTSARQQPAATVE